MRPLPFSARLVLALGCSLASSSAFALVDAQVLGGKRWYKFDSGKRGGTVVQVAAHLDPIPLVPVSFGLSMTKVTLEEGGGVTEASMTETGLDICAWIPLVPVVTPYGRLNYPVYGRALMKSNLPAGTVTNRYESTAKISGPHLSVGLKYSPLPLVKVLLETSLGKQKTSDAETKVNGVKDTNNKDEDLTSKTVLVGLEIGL